MTATNLKIDKHEFVVIPRPAYEKMRAICQHVSKRDRAEAAESLRRLGDAREKRIPWSKVKKRAGLG